MYIQKPFIGIPIKWYLEIIGILFILFGVLKELLKTPITH
jgi:hypothetical protein